MIGNLIAALCNIFLGILVGLNVNTVVYKLASLACAQIGIGMFFVVFIAIQGEIIPKNCAASAYSIIKTIGVSGGIIGPYMIGKIKEIFGSFSIALYITACCHVIATILFIQLRFYMHKPSKSSVDVVSSKNEDFEDIEANEKTRLLPHRK